MFHSLSVTEMSEFFLFKITKAAMKAAFEDMGITLERYAKLELFVKQTSEIKADDVVIRKESVTEIKIEE